MKRGLHSDRFFWLTFTIVGAVAGSTLSSILRGRPDWPFLLGWIFGSTVAFAVGSRWSAGRRGETEAGESGEREE